MKVFDKVRRTPAVVADPSPIRASGQSGPLKARLVVDVRFTLNCLRATGSVASAQEIADDLGASGLVDLVAEILERMVADGMAERIDLGAGPIRYRRL